VAERANLRERLDAARRACDEEQWEEAIALLDAHDRAVRAAVAAGELADPADLEALLHAQQQLILDLQRRQAECSSEIGTLQRNGQAARAYLRQPS
jgi:hypothetical protein